jgi:hypothetical protein
MEEKGEATACDRAAWVEKPKESGAPSATAHAKQHGLPERTWKGKSTPAVSARQYYP